MLFLCEGGISGSGRTADYGTVFCLCVGVVLVYRMDLLLTDIITVERGCGSGSDSMAEEK